MNYFSNLIQILLALLCVDSCLVANFNNAPCVTASNMKFHLFTRRSYNVFYFTSIKRLKRNFSGQRVTKVLIHGWQNKVDSSFSRILVKSYLNKYDANVIVVEWSKYAACKYYKTSRENVPAIGKAVAFLLERLQNDLGMAPSKTHLVGFSLGAHVSGVAGILFKGNAKIGRITGLDPAGPGFSLEDDFRLKEESATFVDVIHTGKWAAGMSDKIGMADYYPNGGMTGFNVVKSHQKAFRFFNESIFHQGEFIAEKCDAWAEYKKSTCKYNEKAEMGEHAPTTARGKYYLDTNEEYPYARKGSKRL